MEYVSKYGNLLWQQIIISKQLHVHYCKCCNLIGYGTRYLFVNTYWVAASNTTRPSFSRKGNAYIFFVFINNFEEIPDKNLFLY